MPKQTLLRVFLWLLQACADGVLWRGSRQRTGGELAAVNGRANADRWGKHVRAWAGTQVQLEAINKIKTQSNQKCNTNPTESYHVASLSHPVCPPDVPSKPQSSKAPHAPPASYPMETEGRSPLWRHRPCPILGDQRRQFCCARVICSGRFCCWAPIVERVQWSRSLPQAALGQLTATPCSELSLACCRIRIGPARTQPQHATKYSTCYRVRTARRRASAYSVRGLSH